MDKLRLSITLWSNRMTPWLDLQGRLCPLAAYCITVCGRGPREFFRWEIEQIGSPIRRRRDQRQTLFGLKLNKIGRVFVDVIKRHRRPAPWS
jgi:hypothetical protein